MRTHLAQKAAAHRHFFKLPVIAFVFVLHQCLCRPGIYACSKRGMAGVRRAVERTRVRLKSVS